MEETIFEKGSMSINAVIDHILFEKKGTVEFSASDNHQPEATGSCYYIMDINDLTEIMEGINSMDYTDVHFKIIP